MNSFCLNGTAINTGSFYVADGEAEFIVRAKISLAAIINRLPQVQYFGASQGNVRLVRLSPATGALAAGAGVVATAIAYRPGGAKALARGAVQYQHMAVRGAAIGIRVVTAASVYPGTKAAGASNFQGRSFGTAGPWAHYQVASVIATRSKTSIGAAARRPVAASIVSFSTCTANGARYRRALWELPLTAVLHSDAITNAGAPAPGPRRMWEPPDYRTMFVPVQMRDMRVT